MSSLTLTASTDEELAELVGWLDDSWLDEESIGFDRDAGAATIEFEQSSGHDGMERSGLPARQLVKSTDSYHEYKRPVLACRLVLHAVMNLEWRGPGGPVAFATYEPQHRRLEAGEGLIVELRRPDATLEVSDRIVWWERLRIGRGLRWESVARWDDEGG